MKNGLSIIPLVLRNFGAIEGYTVEQEHTFETSIEKNPDKGCRETVAVLQVTWWSLGMLKV